MSPIAVNGIGPQLESSDSTLEIYPNPAKDKATVDIIGINGEVTLIIVDISGRIVKKTTIFCNGENCSTNMEIRDLAAGTYFVRASTNGVNIVRRLVVK